MAYAMVGGLGFSRPRKATGLEIPAGVHGETYNSGGVGISYEYDKLTVTRQVIDRNV